MFTLFNVNTFIWITKEQTVESAKTKPWTVRAAAAAGAELCQNQIQLDLS
jgi:hypothetical protein